MSGDKLLGGPQAGIILGARNAIARMRQDPFARALRVDKLTIAALTATLDLYREPSNAIDQIPTLAMIAAPAERVRHRCESVAAVLVDQGINVSIVASDAGVGAGAFPTRHTSNERTT